MLISEFDHHWCFENLLTFDRLKTWLFMGWGAETDNFCRSSIQELDLNLLNMSLLLVLDLNFLSVAIAALNQYDSVRLVVENCDELVLLFLYHSVL